MEKLNNMRGFFVAAITPFTQDNRLNEDALGRLIERTIAQGASGMLVAGSSGECLLLRHEERARLFEVAAQFKDQTALMANVSAVGADEAIEFGRRARAAGCHALISTAPFYYKFSMDAIADYFRAIRSEVDLPLFLYNFPVNTGVEIDISHPAIRAILTDGTIAGVKHTSSNLGQLERIRDLNPALALFGGYDDIYLANRAMGADGAIGSTFNFTLPLFTEIERAYRDEAMGRARAHQQRANDVVEVLGRCGLFPSIKYVLCRQGLDVGQCRRPFPPLTPAQRDALDVMLDEYFR